MEKKLSCILVFILVLSILLCACKPNLPDTPDFTPMPTDVVNETIVPTEGPDIKTSEPSPSPTVEIIITKEPTIAPTTEPVVTPEQTLDVTNSPTNKPTNTPTPTIAPTFTPSPTPSNTPKPSPEITYDVDFNSDIPVVDFISSRNCKGEYLNYIGTSAIKFTMTNPYPSITVDLNSYAAKGNIMIPTGIRYLVVRFAAYGLEEGSFKLNTIYTSSGKTISVGKTASYNISYDDIQAVLFDLKSVFGFDGTISKLTFSYTNSSSSSGIFSLVSVNLSDNLNDALECAGKYQFMLNKDGVDLNFDKLAGNIVKAENEDSNMNFWFDDITEKTFRDKIDVQGTTGYTIYLAKNDTEGAQFFIAPNKTGKYSIKVDPVKNQSGDTLDYSLFFEYYHNIEGNYVPDALPPYKDAINVNAGNSQGFIIKIMTNVDSKAGDYETLIHVYDENGKEVKRAKLGVHVWDFALKDSSTLRTAFYVDTGNQNGYIDSSHPHKTVSLSQLYRNYYDFLIDLRICPMDVPSGATSSTGNKYLSSDKVNACRTTIDNIVEDNEGVVPSWLNKIYYYPTFADEPKTTEQFKHIKDRYEQLKAQNDSFKMVIPFDVNPNLSENLSETDFSTSRFDLLEYMRPYVNIWCPKLEAFTTPEEYFIGGYETLQSDEQTAHYGEFADRMSQNVQEGDELWAYMAINPTEPYVNWLPLSDGTEAIISIWQLKEYNVTGLLYWQTTNWKVNYWNQSIKGRNGDYDGILVYPGDSYGIDGPISSLRLELISQGIEDYEMLTMLEEKLGKDAANAIIERVTTSVVTYTSDDSYLRAVRVMLGNELEKAMKG